MRNQADGESGMRGLTWAPLVLSKDKPYRFLQRYCDKAFCFLVGILCCCTAGPIDGELLSGSAWNAEMHQGNGCCRSEFIPRTGATHALSVALHRAQVSFTKQRFLKRLRSEAIRPEQCSEETLF
jgi:hypothetical protein